MTPSIKLELRLCRPVHTSLKQMCIESASSLFFLNSSQCALVEASRTINSTHKKRRKREKSNCFSPLMDELPSDLKETSAVGLKEGSIVKDNTPRIPSDLKETSAVELKEGSAVKDNPQRIPQGKTIRRNTQAITAATENK